MLADQASGKGGEGSEEERLPGGEEPLRFKGAQLHGHPIDGGGEQQARVVELEDRPPPRACNHDTPPQILLTTSFSLWI